MDWHHPDYLPRRDWEQRDASGGALYARYLPYLHGQVRELLTHYGDIGMIWFDGQWEDSWTHAMGVALYQHCKRSQRRT